MLTKNIIKRRLTEQREEVGAILSQDLVERDKQEEFRKVLQAHLVKVIIGPRRSGKTVLSMLALPADDYHYINFDDELLGTIAAEELNLILELLIELFGKKTYLILDEIQNIDKWELFVNRLQRANYNVILTGSNSKLLSKELSSALTGRTLTVELFPFSFREYLKAREVPPFAKTTPDIGLLRGKLSEHIDEGGFPEVILKLKDMALKKKYLKELFNAAINRDVVQRHQIRYSRQLNECASVIISNFSRRASLRKLSREVGISEPTIKKYIGYLEDAYLIIGVRKFSFKPLEIEKSTRKYYSIDTGYIHAKSLAPSKDFGFLMENLVAVELKRRGLEFYYYLLNGRDEIDFIIRENREITEVIQVTYDEGEIRDREFKKGFDTAKELGAKRLIIITWYREDESRVENIRVNYIPLWKWLLNP